MEYRQLGQTDLKLPVLSFGASSLGQEFRQVDLGQALESVHVALDLGMNYIDTSPFYGRGMSEVMLGIAFREIPRDKFVLSTKLGRYSGEHFDFSARRVVESIDISLERMGVDHIDMVFCHDIEFVEMQQIVDETLPALRKIQEQGKVRYVGISGYPMNIFKFVLDQTELDCVLSYNHYTMQNTMLGDMVPYFNEKGVGVINAAPFSARLLTNAELPPWHKATPKVREVAKAAAEHAASKGVDIAQLAVQFSTQNEDFASCMIGSANPVNIRKWVDWWEAPIDQELMDEVLEILKPIHNWFYIEGREENNDKPVNVVDG